MILLSVHENFFMEQDIKPNSKSQKDKSLEENKAVDPETEISKVVNRHMRNEDDIISEEEFRNLKVAIPPTPPEDESDSQDRSEEGKLRDKEQITPWNILDENSDSF